MADHVAGPAFVKLGRSVRDQRRTLESFIEANRFSNTVEAYHAARRLIECRPLVGPDNSDEGEAWLNP